jgi:hypothetical protein
MMTMRTRLPSARSPTTSAPAGTASPPPATASCCRAASGPGARSLAWPGRPDRRHGQARSARSLTSEALTLM